jgi:regulator of sigma E protease
VNPNPTPQHDIAEPGPIDPATGQPNHQAEVSAVKSWLRQNALSLLITGLGIFLVCKLWDPITALKVAVGLGFIIFIHELGHFLAAKWCDVHVRTFSIGFGPAIPFCSYKWGETTYMLGVIPLGGYVSMVGEGTGESMPDGDADDEDHDPRSFKNKSVWNRMLIISAGVIMNVIFGIVCFAAAYLHGVKEEPASVGALFSGGAAWRSDLRDGDEIVRIGDRNNPTFTDLRPIVMSTDKGEQVPIVVRRNGRELELTVEPIRDEGTQFPQLGISASSTLEVTTPPKRDKEQRVVVRGSKAEEAGGFQPGDRLTGMTDPDNPAKTTPLADYQDYHRRLVLLAGQPVTIEVTRRDGSPAAITIPPSYRAKLGLRMQIGKVAALRANGPAAKAGVKAVSPEEGSEGNSDRIAAVGITNADGTRTWFANGDELAESKKGDRRKPLDPMLLPRELKAWAAEFPAARRGELRVDLVVLRVTDDEHKAQRKLLTMNYDDSYRFARDLLPHANSPLAIDGLGLAYWVTSVVDDVEPGSPAAAAGIQAGDVIEAVQWDTHPPQPSWFTRLIRCITGASEKWDDFKPHQWASVEFILQSDFQEVKLRAKRGDETKEFTLTGVEDKNWPMTERGLILAGESRIQQATDIGDAVNLGVQRTVRFIRIVYMNLYSMIRGRVSVKTMSGPLTIADVSYKIAGEDLWQFLLFLGVISVNLAVVNFLPVPVLDGGHFVFLVYEKITGRPLPERLFAALMWIGLAMILTLFIFVISRDVIRLYF